MRIALRLLAMLGALALLAGCSREPSREQAREWDAELQRLQTEQDSLRVRADDLVSKDPKIQSLPQGDAVVRIPTSFVRSIVEKVVTDVASHITLRLSGIKAHVEKSVKKVVTVGTFTVDVNIQEVLGKLSPQKPEVRFAGNRISLSMPVEVNRGYGKALIHFVWDGKNVAGAACGDMDITQAVSGNVIPSKYVITGALDLALKGNKIVGSPKFPETRVNIRVTPTKESWAAVDSILALHHGVCGWVLDKVNVPSLLKNLVEVKGFNVKLPLDNVKPFVIPAGIRDSVTVGDRKVSVETTSNLIKVEPEAILYSASVVLK